MKILLANPRGFCAGVDRAIEMVKAALAQFGAPIYVRHEVVHNRYVVAELKAQGVCFVEELTQVPDQAVVVFSAHGVSQAIKAQAKARQLHMVLDATCPLVSKVHMEVIRYSQRAQECILIGHAGHPEVAGTLGQYRHPEGAIYLVETLQDIAQLKVKDPTQLGYVTQTTLSVDDTQAMVAALRQRFPAIQGPNKEDICYATQNRQTAVKQLAEQTEVVLVIGSKNSSNSNRLQELVRRYNKPAYLIDEVKQIDNAWLVGKESVGITAGASAPEVLVQQVVAYLQQQFKVTAVTEVAGETENVYFALPKSLRTEPVAKAIATPILPTV